MFVRVQAKLPPISSTYNSIGKNEVKKLINLKRPDPSNKQQVFIVLLNLVF